MRPDQESEDSSSLVSGAQEDSSAASEVATPQSAATPQSEVWSRFLRRTWWIWLGVACMVIGCGLPRSWFGRQRVAFRVHHVTVSELPEADFEKYLELSGIATPMQSRKVYQFVGNIVLFPNLNKASAAFCTCYTLGEGGKDISQDDYILCDLSMVHTDLGFPASGIYAWANNSTIDATAVPHPQKITMVGQPFQYRYYREWTSVIAGGILGLLALTVQIFWWPVREARANVASAVVGPATAPLLST